MVWGSAFRGYGFRVCDFTLLVRDFAFGVRGFQGFAFAVRGFRGFGLWMGVSGSGFHNSWFRRSGFRVSGFRVRGSGFSRFEVSG